MEVIQEKTIVLTAKELTRRFGGVVAVNNLSFSVNQGEIFGFIGPNGAGKTTLFNLITGLIPPSSGELIYQNQVISQLQPYQIAGLGIARTFQNIRLFGELSVLDNVIIARHLHTQSNIMDGVLGLPLAVQEEENSRQKALELLRLIGLDNRTAEKAKNLAYGDQRRDRKSVV